MYFKKIPETIINTFVIPALLKQFDYVYTFMILNIYSALSKFMIRKRIKFNMILLMYASMKKGLVALFFVNAKDYNGRAL